MVKILGGIALLLTLLTTHSVYAIVLTLNDVTLSSKTVTNTTIDFNLNEVTEDTIVTSIDTPVFDYGVDFDPSSSENQTVVIETLAYADAVLSFNQDVATYEMTGSPLNSPFTSSLFSRIDLSLFNITEYASLRVTNTSYEFFDDGATLNFNRFYYSYGIFGEQYYKDQGITYQNNFSYSVDAYARLIRPRAGDLIDVDLASLLTYLKDADGLEFIIEESLSVGNGVNDGQGEINKIVDVKYNGTALLAVEVSEPSVTLYFLSAIGLMGMRSFKKRKNGW